jgi:hypothetical protein
MPIVVQAVEDDEFFKWVLPNNWIESKGDIDSKVRECIDAKASA